MAHPWKTRVPDNGTSVGGTRYIWWIRHPQRGGEQGEGREKERRVISAPRDV